MKLEKEFYNDFEQCMDCRYFFGEKTSVKLSEHLLRNVL